MKTMTSRVRCGAALLAITVLAGCATPPPPPPKPQADPARDSLMRLLADGQALPAHADSADVAARPAAMAGDLVTIRGYAGSAQNLLSRFARARGMKFEETGPYPRLPLLVVVDVTSMPLEDFLSVVGRQFGQRAALVLGDGRLEIRYRGNY